MKKMGSTGMKWLKVFHLVSMSLWFGGVASLLALISGADLTNFDMVNAAYNSMRSIDSTVVRNGGQGILITSLIYSIGTNWGFFKHKWVAAKWGIFIAQMAFGIAYLNGLIEKNIEILHTEKALALSNQAFLNNHTYATVGLLTQCIIIVVVIWISVIKPWKSKNNSRAEK